MPTNTHKLRDVYGVSRDMPLNYVERKDVDKIFVNSLTRDRHIVIYGSSKQGKTLLRKHCLKEDDCIVISCLNSMDLSDLHGAILKSAGYQIERSKKLTVSGHHKYSLEFRGEGKVPFVGSLGGEGALEREKSKKEETEHAKIEIDLKDVNDIIISLRHINFSKFIVLEDFHYLPVEIQRTFSFALKAYHENSQICFIVVGVWREKNRLIYYNGDLTNRVASIDVDKWDSSSLLEVLHAGEALLNINFDPSIANSLADQSYESVSLLQEACFRICEAEGVYETQPDFRVVGASVDVGALMKEIVDDQAGRYSAFIDNFAEGFTETEYDMYRWIIFAVLSVEIKELDNGIRRNIFSKIIKEKHPMGRKLNEGNITTALQKSASLQMLKSIRPIILDYDQTTKVMNVVDRSFLIWLSLQDRQFLIRSLDLEL